MTQFFRIFPLTIILLHSCVFTFGQNKSNKVFRKHLTVEAINKICRTIDENKNLGEAVKEGETLNKKGGFDIYYLKDFNRILYRVTYNISTDKYCNSVYYYNHKKVIKAIITITDKDLTKPKYSATYYFDNNKLIEKTGENTKYSNFKDILKQGIEFQNEFYSDTREKETACNKALASMLADE